MATLMVSSPAFGREVQDFSQAYGVWISTDKGHCIYWLTDVGLDAGQLADALTNSYETKRGLEILTSGDTPKRCVSDARAAAARAGFQLIRSRQGTEKDRLHGIP
jgi:hypothetical protein